MNTLSLEIENLISSIVMELTRVQTCVVFAAMIVCMLFIFLGYLFIANRMIKEIRKEGKV